MAHTLVYKKGYMDYEQGYKFQTAGLTTEVIKSTFTPYNRGYKILHMGFTTVVAWDTNCMALKISIISNMHVVCKTVACWHRPYPRSTIC